MKKNIFERVEKKYLASPEQCRAFLELAEGRLLPGPVCRVHNLQPVL